MFVQLISASIYCALLFVYLMTKKIYIFFFFFKLKYFGLFWSLTAPKLWTVHFNCMNFKNSPLVFHRKMSTSLNWQIKKKKNCELFIAKKEHSLWDENDVRCKCSIKSCCSLKFIGWELKWHRSHRSTLRLWSLLHQPHTREQPEEYLVCGVLGEQFQLQAQPPCLEEGIRR